MVNVHSGVVITKYKNKAASTAITMGAMLEISSGYATPITSSSALVYGSSQVTVTSASDDYASTTRIPITVPTSRTMFRMTVTGTFVATQEGDLFDASDSVTVDADASTYDIFLCEKYISATEGIFSIPAPLRQ